MPPTPKYQQRQTHYNHLFLESDKQNGGQHRKHIIFYRGEHLAETMFRSEKHHMSFPKADTGTRNYTCWMLLKIVSVCASHCMLCM